MIKNLKKAFTIIELVIVIAVIAILAAVMIPTYSSLVKKANLSADEQAVKQMNTALAIYEAENGKKPEDVIKAKLALDENLINTESMVPVTQGYAFYWDKGENKVVLVAYGKAIDDDWELLTSSNGYGKEPKTTVIDEESLQNAINESSNNDPVLIKLSNDITLTDEIEVVGGQCVILDLNDNTLNITEDFNDEVKYLNVNSKGSLTIKNGKIEASGRAIQNKQGTLILDDVIINGGVAKRYSTIFVDGISDTSITNCKINYEAWYGIATNSSLSESDGARISIINSDILPLNASSSKGVCGINITINANITIDGCKITGYDHGIYLRGCTAIIKDSTINYTGNGNKDSEWSQGDTGKAADIVFACGGTNEFTGYITTGNYTCENVTANIIYVHEPKGGKVSVSGINVTKKYTETQIVD